MFLCLHLLQQEQRGGICLAQIFCCICGVVRSRAQSMASIPWSRRASQTFANSIPEQHRSNWEGGRNAQRGGCRSLVSIMPTGISWKVDVWFSLCGRFNALKASRDVSSAPRVHARKFTDGSRGLVLPSFASTGFPLRTAGFRLAGMKKPIANSFCPASSVQLCCHLAQHHHHYSIISSDLNCSVSPHIFLDTSFTSPRDFLFLQSPGPAQKNNPQSKCPQRNWKRSCSVC